MTVAPSAFTQGAAANEGSAAPTSHAMACADLAARSAAGPATLSKRECARRSCAMLTRDLANSGEETLGCRTATAIGADAAKPRSEAIFVILAHRHRSRWSMQKHNKIFHSAAKRRANIDVSQKSGTAQRFGRCRAPSLNQCADHDILCAMAQGGAIRFNLAFLIGQAKSTSQLPPTLFASSLNKQRSLSRCFDCEQRSPSARSRLAFSRRGPCVPSRSALGPSHALHQGRKQGCPSSLALSSRRTEAGKR